MCTAYAGVLNGDEVRAGQFAQGQELATCELPPEIDGPRAKNEIAVFNHDTREVLYGVDGLGVLLQGYLPFLPRLLKVPPIRWLLRMLYALVSYNRKVITPPVNDVHAATNNPDLHLGFRWAYIAFCWLFTSSILAAYAPLLKPLIPATSFAREFFICGGQILFQSSLLLALNRERTLDYLGNMMTVSLIGAVLLTPILIMGQWWNPGALSFCVYFMAVVGVMLFEHARRMPRLGLNVLPTIGWVVYRLLVLGAILWGI